MGDALTLSGPDQKSLQMLPATPDFHALYQAQIPQSPLVASPESVPPPFLSPGLWQVSGNGSSTVEPFQGQIALPSPVRITKPVNGISIDPQQDLTITWNGSDY